MRAARRACGGACSPRSALFAGWTAASWLWSESPPRALDEAPRVALYARRGCRRRACRAPRPGRVDRRRRRRRRDARRRLEPRRSSLAASIIRATRARLPSRSATRTGSRSCASLGLVLLPRLPAACAARSGPARRRSWEAGEHRGARRARCRTPRVRLHDAAAAAGRSSPQPPSLRSRSRRFAFRGHDRRPVLARRRARGERASGCRLRRGDVRELVAARPHACRFSTQEAHSLYLETLAELGPLGLALLLAALAVPLAAAVRIREAGARRGACRLRRRRRGRLPLGARGRHGARSAPRRDRRGARFATRPRRPARRHGAGLRGAHGRGAPRLRGRRASRRRRGRAARGRSHARGRATRRARSASPRSPPTRGV